MIPLLQQRRHSSYFKDLYHGHKETVDNALIQSNTQSSRAFSCEHDFTQLYLPFQQRD